MDNTIWQSFMKMQSEWNDIEQATLVSTCCIANDDLAIEKCKELGIAL